ncbi:hypothetical protein V491_09294 [Pseudogymnoascus sp. VKM F-3775]|nr:hypothetical protein V491_09294 [Pseudogymnoascus sp. VKM F-3775]
MPEYITNTMSSHMPPSAPSRPIRTPCSTRYRSTSSSTSSSSTVPLTPRTSSPTPSTDKPIPDESDAALSKATQEFTREIARLEREKAELEREMEKLLRERDEFKSACDKAALATKQKQETERQEIWDSAYVVAGMLLAIPAVFIAISIFVSQFLAGMRMLSWAVYLVGG